MHLAPQPAATFAPIVPPPRTAPDHDVTDHDVTGTTAATPVVVVALCRCGHERDVHEHFRAGTDCSVCGAGCRAFHARTGRGARSETALLRAAPRPRRHRRPVG